MQFLGFEQNYIVVKFNFKLVSEIADEKIC